VLRRTTAIIAHGTCARVYGLLTGANSSGMHPLAGTAVDLCETSLSGCTSTTTDAFGRYEVHKALPAGQSSHDYRIRAHGKGTFVAPPTQTSPATTMTRGGDYRIDEGWDNIQHLPANIQLPGARTGGGYATWYYLAPQPLHVDGACPPGINGSATYRVIGTVAPDIGVWFGPAPMTHNLLDGSFDAVIPPLHPHHGHAILEITVECDGRSTTTTVDVYIDPSGFVHDTTGKPIPAAIVTLYRYEGATLGFQQLPNGSAVMSPSNRRNSDLTDANGHFQWDVTAGQYKVRAQKSGCHAPGSAVAYVETAILTIPPPVTNIDLFLECERKQG
jgi:hypothetical protein